MQASLGRRLADMLEHHFRQRSSRRATARAIRNFSRLHEEWYQSAFDEWFLTRLPEGLLDSKDAAALAREWTRQFRYEDERRRERDVEQLLGVAESFLALLAAAEEESMVRSRAFGHRQRGSRLAVPKG